MDSALFDYVIGKFWQNLTSETQLHSVTPGYPRQTPRLHTRPTVQVSAAGLSGSDIIQLQGVDTMKRTLMKSPLGLLAFGILGLAATGAEANWDRDGHSRHAFRQSQVFSEQIDTRQDRQLDRIRAGMHTGRLTRAEFHELMHEQREIRAMERYFRADGIIDEREFRRLDRALDQAGLNIRAEKHDRQDRYAYQAHPWQD